MNKPIFLLLLIFLGCDVNIIQGKYVIEETTEFFIPDSNKQNYADFVSKSVSGCKDDCSYFLRKVKEEGGKIYGTRIVELRTRSSKITNDCDAYNCFDSTISKNDMSQDELLLVKDFYVK